MSYDGEDDGDEDDADEIFMERFGITEPQFGVVATFYAIMTHQPEVIEARPSDLKVTRAELEDHRSRVFDMFLGISKLIDAETIEVNGALDTTVSESGVGVFSHERMTRAAIRSFDGMSHEEIGKRAGIVAEAVECLSDMMTRKLLYMAAEAVKAHPDWTALDILKSLNDHEQFAEWNERAVPHLDVDDEEACDHGDGCDHEHSYEDSDSDEVNDDEVTDI